MNSPRSNSVGTCQATVVVLHVKSFQNDCVAHFLVWQECGLADFANVIDKYVTILYLNIWVTRHLTRFTIHTGVQKMPYITHLCRSIFFAGDEL